MLVKVFGAAVQGIESIPITIEVNCSKGIRFLLVGLPDTSVKESHERIVSALEVNGLKFPRQQIVINMSPADIRKEGSAFDLPLAVGILGASGSISSEKFTSYMLMGELSLDGTVLPLKGALPMALMAKEDRKSTRLNSSHVRISYAVFCLKKKKKKDKKERNLKKKMKKYTKTNNQNAIYEIMLKSNVFTIDAL